MKALFTPYSGGSIAHTVRSLAIADELKRQGHEVLFTSSNKRKEFIERAGFPVWGDGHPEVNFNDEHDQSITYFKDHRQDLLAWWEDEIEAATHFRPNIIISSPSFFGPYTSYKTDIPYVSVINAQWLTAHFKGLLGLGKSTNSFSDALIRTIGQPVFRQGFDRLYAKEANSFYQELGIPGAPSRMHHVHAHNPALIPSVPEFEPIKATHRKDLHYIGPLFWNGFEKQPLNPEELFTHFNDKPFVYVSLGGSIYRKQSYAELIAALLQRPEWNILLTLGPNMNMKDFSLPEKSHVVLQAFTPGLKACSYADIIINTASHGTVMQALWHGKPVIALPHNIDQATIAARLEELKIGYNLNPLSLTDFTHRERHFQRATAIPWERVLRTTEIALQNKEMYREASNFQKIVRRYGDAEQQAVNYIKQYAR